MKLTVAVCTWNRAALLDQTLERMRVLAAPPGATWELLVVNNNSTDDTDAVLSKHEAHLPLRRLFEPKQGHSNARNCAVDHAAGDLLIWTDDDVLVEPDWLTEYAAAAAAYPHAGYFGGTVEPWFEAPPPRWVLRNLAHLEGPFALRRLGGEVRPLRDGEHVFGANMAFRTELLRRFRFDPALGRVGTGMLSGDDTELVDRVKAAGGTGVWVGTARVKHYIPAGRLSADYVWKFFRGLGRTNFRRDPNASAGPRLFGLPRWLVRNYVSARLRSLVLAPSAGRGWVNSFAAAATARGMIDEARERGPV